MLLLPVGVSFLYGIKSCRLLYRFFSELDENLVVVWIVCFYYSCILEVWNVGVYFILVFGIVSNTNGSNPIADTPGGGVEHYFPRASNTINYN